MKILVCSQANIFEPDIISTFCAMGFEVDKFEHSLTNSFLDNTYLNALSAKLLSTSYNFVFSANYIPVTSMVCQVHKINYISWIADSPCVALNSSTISNSCNHIFIFDKILYEYYKKQSKNTIYYLPLGSNISRMNEIFLTPKDYATYHSDVSFVGSLYATRTKYSTIPLSDYWKGYFEGILESQLNLWSGSLLEDSISDEAIQAFSEAADFDSILKDTKSSNFYQFDLRDFVINSYISQESTYRGRMRMVKKLAQNFNFNLYTTDDTKNYPFIQNKGVVEPFVEAFKVYKSTKVNINITSTSIRSGLPLRIFDILGSQGFLITNYQAELSELFEIGKDLVIYENNHDLIEKIHYYLAHEEERVEIAKNGYHKVCYYYQLEHQIKKMLIQVLGNK